MLKTGVEPDAVACGAPANALVNTDEQKAGQEGSANLFGRGVATWPGAGCDLLQRTGRCFDQ